jgi:homoserine O-acetyltransferase
MDHPEPQTFEDQPGEVGLVEWKDFVSNEPFSFASGESIPGITLRYETYGQLSAAKDNVILICHALSGDYHCAGVHDLRDRKTGWWHNIIGPGKPIDTTRFFVVCSNVLGGCQGSTGPTSINPQTGLRFDLDFPLLSIEDMVAAQELLLRKEFGIEQIYAVVGGSMGGMQALQWGIQFPDKVERLLPMATTARQNAQAIAFNEVGRLAIMQDPEWHDGTYPEAEGPAVGLAIARMMAHITYLSNQGMEDKFGRERVATGAARERFGAEFQVESYLRYQGQTFTSRFDANTYLYLTKALDRFDLYGASGKLEESLAAVSARTLVIGFTSDWLFPPEQNRSIVHALLRAGKEASYAELEMTLGHDSFLIDAPELYTLVKDFLK